MSSQRSNDRPCRVAEAPERETLGRVYSRVRRSLAERIEVDAEIERRLAVIVFLVCCAEQRFSQSASGIDEAAAAEACVVRLLAKTTTVARPGLH